MDAQKPAAMALDTGVNKWYFQFYVLVFPKISMNFWSKIDKIESGANKSWHMRFDSLELFGRRQVVANCQPTYVKCKPSDMSTNRLYFL